MPADAPEPGRGPAGSPELEIGERLAVIRRAVAAAATRAGREPGSVRVIAAAKSFPPSYVSATLAAGVTDIGENYVQEARAKRAAVANRGTWHLIGGLQRNKVKLAAAIFDRVHTVDAVPLAEALAGAVGARSLPVLIEVNLAGEPAKRGVSVEGLEGLAQAVLRLDALVLEGLMAVPPHGGPEGARGHFRQLRELRDRVANRLGVELPHLSMGMSDDFTVAVEEGATWLRLGRALFGARGPAAWRPGSSAGGEGS